MKNKIKKVFNIIKRIFISQKKCKNCMYYYYEPGHGFFCGNCHVNCIKDNGRDCNFFIAKTALDY